MTKTHIAFILIFFVYGLVLGHRDENHDNKVKAKDEISKAQLNQIGNAYVKDIEPIFKKKCFDCHASNPSLPWYSRIPGPKQIIQDDIRAAKKHLDMTEGFPFKGHGTPVSDLKEIRETIEENSMPPFRYKMLHWGSGLTKDDKDKILEWINRSLK